MKIIKNIGLFAVITGSLLLASCNVDETIEREGKPTVTVLNKNIEAFEGSGVNLDFNFTYEIKEEAQIRVEVIGGTAEEGTDYNFNLTTIANAGFGYFGGEGYIAEIPAFSKNYKLTDFITVVNDNVTETPETIQLRLTSVSKATILISETLTINLNDLVPTTLDVLLDFDGDMTIDGSTFDKCGLDFDIYISDDASTPYSSTFNAFNYLACNEDIGTSNQGLLDNTNTGNWNTNQVYYIYVDFWAKNNASVAGSIDLPTSITTHENIPMELGFTKVKEGVTTNLSLDLPTLFKTDDTASEDGTTQEEGIRKIGTIEIFGNNYIITNEITGEQTTF